MSLIKLENVSKYYRSDNNISAGMKDVSVSFDLNEFVAIIGESGSGKSTLLNVISGLDGYQEGEMYLNGEETSHFTVANWEVYRSKYIGFVFQNYNIIDSYTVLQNVLLALEIQNYPKEKRMSRALELIDKVGLTSHKHHRASKLSGGQKQRTVIARALAKDCPIIVCDEPTGNLDSQSGAEVLRLLAEISKDKLVIVVSHNYEELVPYVTRRIKMHDGHIIEDKHLTSSVITDSIINVESAKMSFSSLIRFALRNIFAMPKRLIFFLALYVIVIGAFIMTYTNNVISMSSGIDGDFSFGYAPIANISFRNIGDNRVIITRKDYDIFNEDDKNYLSSSGSNLSKAVYINDFFLDLSTMYPYAAVNKSNEIYVDHFDGEGLINFNLVTGSKTTMPQSNQNYQIIVSDGFDLSLNDKLTFSYEDVNFNQVSITFDIVGIYKDNRSRTVYFSDHFLRSKDSEPSGVATISFNNIIDAKSYLNQVDRTKYRVFFPAHPDAQISFIKPLNTILTIFLYFVTLGLGFFLYLIVHAVTKNIMRARKKDFAIYRSIGANQSNLAILVVVEQVILFIISLILTTVLMALLRNRVYTFYLLFSAIKFSDVIAIITTLFILTIWLGLRYNKRIFNFSVIETLTQSKEDIL